MTKKLVGSFFLKGLPEFEHKDEFEVYFDIAQSRTHTLYKSAWITVTLAIKIRRVLFTSQIMRR